MKKLYKFLALCISLALVLSMMSGLGVSASETSNSGLIANGGFEDGTWAPFAYRSNLSKRVSVDTTEYHSGSYSVKLDGATAQSFVNNAFYVNVDVIPETNYVWTFYAKMANAQEMSAGANAAVAVKEADTSTNYSGTIISSTVTAGEGGTVGGLNSNYRYIHKSAEDTWVRYTVEFNSGDYSNVSLGWINYYMGVTVYTDDWSLVKKPLITDGGFENGNTSGFSLRANISSVTSVVADAAQSGSYGVKINGAASNSYQNNAIHTVPIAVQQNTDYVWSFYVKYDNNSTNKQGYIAIRDAASSTTFGGTLINNFTVTIQNGYAGTVGGVSGYTRIYANNKDEWSKVTVNFNSGNYETISLGYCNYDKNIVYMDDWSLIEKPFTATITTDENGSVTGPTTIEAKASATYSIIPVDGYKLSSLFVNGIERATEVIDNTYTIDSVTEDIAISATFEKIPGMVVNGGFEYGTKGFALRSGISSVSSIITDNVFSGNKSLRVAGTVAEGWANRAIHTEAISVKPNTSYEWSFKIDFEEGANAYICVKDASSANDFTGSYLTLTSVSMEEGTVGSQQNTGYQGIYGSATVEGWQTVTVKFNTGDYTSISLGVSNYNSATFCLDDWSLETIAGDANGDCVTDIRDLVRMKRYVVNVETVISAGADFDNNDLIDAYDLTALRKKLLNLD